MNILNFCLENVSSPVYYLSHFLSGIDSIMKLRSAPPRMVIFLCKFQNCPSYSFNRYLSSCPTCHSRSMLPLLLTRFGPEKLFLAPHFFSEYLLCPSCGPNSVLIFSRSALFFSWGCPWRKGPCLSVGPASRAH